jgi:hypothetical protein
MEPADLPRFDLRTLTSLQTLALGAVGNAMVCLAPDLEDLDLTLTQVGDLDRVLEHVGLGHVRCLNLNVGLAVSWERLCMQLVRVRELVLPRATVLALSNSGSRKRLGPEFRALLGRVCRLDLVCAGPADFLQSLLEATGPGLRGLILRKPEAEDQLADSWSSARRVGVPRGRGRGLDPCKAVLVASRKFPPCPSRKGV